MVMLIESLQCSQGDHKCCPGTTKTGSDAFGGGRICSCSCHDKVRGTTTTNARRKKIINIPGDVKFK